MITPRTGTPPRRSVQARCWARLRPGNARRPPSSIRRKCRTASFGGRLHNRILSTGCRLANTTVRWVSRSLVRRRREETLRRLAPDDAYLVRCSQLEARRLRVAGTSAPSRGELVEVLADQLQLLRTTGVTVMMSQPISSAWTMFSSSRGLAQSSSMLPAAAADRLQRLRHQRDRIAAGVGDAAGEHRDDRAAPRPPAPAATSRTCSSVRWR